MEPAPSYAGGVSRSTVAPLGAVEFGDLVALHAAAAIELHTDTSLLGLWETVAASTLDYSGIRLRNARLCA